VTARITRESLRAARACYSDARIAELVPAKGLSPAEVAALPIPAVDRHWALVYAAGGTDRTLREHACWCARQALALVTSPDPRSVAAVEVAERHARGEATDAELDAARAAAWAAARDAARAAAWDAAWDAARDAARDAAWDAARDAAWDAWAAARDAARAAARAAARDAAWAASDAAWAAQVADLAARLEVGS
jgi:hypothetical protein